MFKKIAILFSLSFVLVGCSQDKPKTEETPKKESATEETASSVKPVGISDIKVDGKDGNYTVTGKVTGNIEPLFYASEDGHYEFVPEKEVVVKDNAFTIKVSIPTDKLPTNGVLTLQLYKKDTKGDIIPVENVVLQKMVAEEKAVGISDVKVEGKGGSYTLTGKVTGKAEQLYYSSEDGHYEFVSETKLDVKANAFNVKIVIPKDELPTNGVITLQVYKKKTDGTIESVKDVVLEKFGE